MKARENMSWKYIKKKNKNYHEKRMKWKEEISKKEGKEENNDIECLKI